MKHHDLINDDPPENYFFHRGRSVVEETIMGKFIWCWSIITVVLFFMALSNLWNTFVWICFIQVGVTTVLFFALKILYQKLKNIPVFYLQYLIWNLFLNAFYFMDGSNIMGHVFMLLNALSLATFIALEQKKFKFVFLWALPFALSMMVWSVSWSHEFHNVHYGVVGICASLIPCLIFLLLQNYTSSVHKTSLLYQQQWWHQLNQETKWFTRDALYEDEDDVEKNKSRNSAFLQQWHDQVYHTLNAMASTVQCHGCAFYLYDKEHQKAFLSEQFSLEDNVFQEYWITIDSQEYTDSGWVDELSKTSLKEHEHIKTKALYAVCEEKRLMGFVLIVWTEVLEKQVLSIHQKTLEPLITLVRQLYLSERARLRAQHRFAQMEKMFQIARTFQGIKRPESVVAAAMQSMIQCCVSGVLFLEKSRIQQKDWMRVIGQEGQVPLVIDTMFEVQSQSWLDLALRQQQLMPRLPFQNNTATRGLMTKAPDGVAKNSDQRCIPLVLQGESQGALVIWSTEGRVWTSLDAEVLSFVADVTSIAWASAQAYVAVTQLAATDGLTGLWNRRAMEDAFEKAVARYHRLGIPFSLIMVDADHFKSVNDQYGHGVGDDVLKSIASVLKNHARQEDTVARLGGEEFVLLLDNSTTQAANLAAERMRQAISTTFVQTEQGPISVTVSMGVVSIIDTAQENAAALKDMMLDAADKALYRAKANGRNRVENAMMEDVV